MPRAECYILEGATVFPQGEGSSKSPLIGNVRGVQRSVALLRMTNLQDGNRLQDGNHLRMTKREMWGPFGLAAGSTKYPAEPEPVFSERSSPISATLQGS